MTERMWEMGDDDRDVVAEFVAALVDRNVAAALKDCIESDEAFLFMQDGKVVFQYEGPGVLALKGKSLVKLVREWPIGGNVTRDGHVSVYDKAGLADLLATKAALEEALALVNAALPLCRPSPVP